MSQKLTDLYVQSEELLPTPHAIKNQLPIKSHHEEVVSRSRQDVRNILDGKDSRLFLVVGPCSIHDVEAARDYAEKLKSLADKVSDTFVLLMRVYFSKPRTTIGWKGLINDPFLDDSFRIDRGLLLARQLLLDVADIGVGVGTEALDSVTPQYMDDLLAWSAIGARTAESQTHREMASGLSTPVGIKNGTDGSIKVAVNALQTMQHPHAFLGINQFGQSIVLRTTGNPYGHIILRGGEKPNYDSISVQLVEKELQAARLKQNIVIDCSHGNSSKNHDLQPVVFKDCIEQVVASRAEKKRSSIVGLMLESNLLSGRQELTADKSELRYGVSITDACISWEATRKLILEAAEIVAAC
jgi:3-deoxy-7-phosphoheptulonate synthase